MRDSKIYLGLLIAAIVMILTLSGCAKTVNPDAVEQVDSENIINTDVQEPVIPIEPAPTTPACGDSNLDDGEECDGDVLANITCESKGYDSGIVSCTECKIDLSECKVVTISSTGACVDTDDGMDYAVKGTVTMTTGDSSKKYADYCRQADGPFNGYVFEYYCANDTVQSENYRCPVKCNNGACI